MTTTTPTHSARILASRQAVIWTELAIQQIPEALPDPGTISPVESELEDLARIAHRLVLSGRRLLAMIEHLEAEAMAWTEIRSTPGSMASLTEEGL